MQIGIATVVIICVVVAIACLAIGYFVSSSRIAAGAQGKIAEADKRLAEAERKIADAASEAENIKRSAQVEAKDAALEIKRRAEDEAREQSRAIKSREDRLSSREESCDRRVETLDQREKQLSQQASMLEEGRVQLAGLIDEADARLTQIAAMSREEARETLLETVKDDVTRQSAQIIRDAESQVKAECDRKSREILSVAIQRMAADYTAERTVTSVTIPSDDVKGRIIGREGRNIRALETATGVDLVIDDTPEAIIVSAFDPVRREIARIAVEKLIMDGRIHPARIEEMVEKARKEVDNQIREAGENAVFETNQHGMHHELVKLLGRLKYRTSYGQNVLKHSLEVSHLAGLMAAELGADVQLAKRAGLLHDIGKAVDHEAEGTHVTLGGELARKYHESPDVIHAILAHHNDVEPQTVEAVLVQAADALSAARPGARRESVENFIKRLEKLEEIANSFDGVEKCFAIQSGREVRIMVKPDDVTDEGTKILAKEIAKRIEKEMEYPGQIRVNVIRETRSTEYAK